MTDSPAWAIVRVMMSVRGTSWLGRTTAGALLLQLVVLSALPLAEAFHDHARAYDTEWHAADDPCRDGAGHGDCPLLRVGTTPGLASNGAGASTPTDLATLHVPAPVVAPSSTESFLTTLPRAPPLA